MENRFEGYSLEQLSLLNKHLQVAVLTTRCELEFSELIYRVALEVAQETRKAVTMDKQINPPHIFILPAKQKQV